MSFIHPLYLGLFVFVLIWLARTHKNPLKLPTAIQQISIYYPLLQALNSTPNKQPHTQSNRLIVALFFTLIILSFAQPSIKTPFIHSQTNKQAVDLIMVVNTSVSMVLKDYQKNGQSIDRMQKTKQVLSDLVQQFKGQRVALVVLGRPASVWLPLTTDKQQALNAIARLQTTLGGRNNDIGQTLQLVKNTFKQTTEQKKIVLLVNDGYSQIGSISPIESVKELTKQGFTLHSLAIGSPKRPEFSLGIGHLIYAPVDLELMQSLATNGKGKMIHAWKNDAVAEILAAINVERSKPNKSKTQFKTQSLVVYPLGLALFLLFVMLMPVRKKS